jgi:TolB-like protein/Flp pilus assembly protein TadD
MPSERIQLGRFLLDIRRYELSCGGKPVRLERIPMDLLILLVREEGRLVSRDEIVARLWGKDVFLDTDNSINTAIRKIRRALEDDPEKPRYIETVLGKGYRFKGADNVGVSFPAPPPQRRPAIMLALLPFENLSGDPSQEYFSDGLTEEAIMRLGRMSPHRMGVIARTSSMAYKHTSKSVRQIGEELGVDFIVEGSVRREQTRVRVTAQLIRVHDQIHIWAENFDYPPQSILDMHATIATAIAAQVKLKLTPDEQFRLQGPSGNNQAAYDQYLRGRYHHAKITFVELQKAIGYFRKATELDPTLAVAYSGLALSFVRLPIASDIRSRQAFPHAKAAAARALELDPYSAEAHACDAAIKFWFEWDYASAEASARKAIDLDSSYSPAYLFLAHTLSNTGRHEEALPVIRQALVVDPFSLITNTMLGQFLYHARKLEQSVRQLKATLDMEARFWVAHICLAKTYEALGMYTEALLACERAFELSGGNSEALSLAGYIHAENGDKARARAKVQQMQEQEHQQYVPPYNFALVYAALGQTDDALPYLDRALNDRDVHMTFLRDHKWNRLRTDSRFTELLRRCNLSQ